MENEKRSRAVDGVAGGSPVRLKPRRDPGIPPNEKKQYDAAGAVYEVPEGFTSIMNIKGGVDMTNDLINEKIFIQYASSNGLPFYIPATIKKFGGLGMQFTTQTPTPCLYFAGKPPQRLRLRILISQRQN